MYRSVVNIFSNNIYLINIPGSGILLSDEVDCLSDRPVCCRRVCEAQAESNLYLSVHCGCAESNVVSEIPDMK